MNRTRVAGIGVLCVLAFIFLAPVVFVEHSVFPVSCIVYYCHWPVYESITYWAFGIGGVWMSSGYYTFVT